jgi:hypothetical protein
MVPQNVGILYISKLFHTAGQAFRVDLFFHFCCFGMLVLTTLWMAHKHSNSIPNLLRCLAAKSTLLAGKLPLLLREHNQAEYKISLLANMHGPPRTGKTLFAKMAKEDSSLKESVSEKENKLICQIDHSKQNQRDRR